MFNIGSFSIIDKWVIVWYKGFKVIWSIYKLSLVYGVMVYGLMWDVLCLCVVWFFIVCFVVFKWNVV